MPYESNFRRTRVLQLGSGLTALSALESLVERFEVVGLVREHHPETAKDDLTIRLAQSLEIPVLPDASAGAIVRSIKELKPDCVVVSSHKRILTPSTLAKCRFINVHYAPLPKYRGRANVNWALINGEQFAAITIHMISPGLDEGNILFQESIEIGESDDVTSLYERLNAIQRKALALTVLRHLDGHEGIPQDHQKATYGCTRIPDDGEIDWTRPASEIHRLIRALTSPSPGAFTYHEGRRLWIRRAELVAHPPRFDGRVPGRVASISQRYGSVDVLAGEGLIRLLEVQREGDAAEPASKVLRSVRETLGLRTSDLLARIDRLERLLSSKGLL